jgi:hypothetical protein
MHKNKYAPLAMFTMALMVLLGGGSFAETSTQAHMLPSHVAPPVDTLSEAAPEKVDLEETGAPHEEPPVDPLEEERVEPLSKNPWASFPNVCESFTAHQGEVVFNKRKGRKTASVQYKRNRYAYPVSDQKRTKELIRLVAREMGVAEPDFFVAMAAHESSFHPEAVHILNEDLSANKKSWEKHNYTPAREAKLLHKLKEASTQNGAFWKVRSALNSLRTYKGNPFWDARIEYDFVIPGRVLADGSKTPEQTIKATKSAWALGYGLYGHNAVLYTKTWSPEAPPWILCSHQGILDTIIEVWVARSAMRECEELSATDPAKYGAEGGTYLGSLRRLGTGHCSDRPLRKQWQVLLAEYGDSKNLTARGGGVPWSRKADFGKKWPVSSDREEILAHMLRRAEEEGLLRPAPLQRKKDGSEPVVIARK